MLKNTTHLKKNCLDMDPSSKSNSLVLKILSNVTSEISVSTLPRLCTQISVSFSLRLNEVYELNTREDR